MASQRIRDIIQKLAKEQCTEEELKEFEQWTASAPPEEMSVLMDDYYYSLPASPEFASQDGIGDKIEKKLNQLRDEKSHAPSYQKTFARFALAAVVLFLIVSSYLILSYQSAQSEEGTLAKKASPIVINPGRNKATLQLSDGSVVSLDDMQNRAIDKEASVGISKVDNQLVYNSKGGETAGAPLYNTLSTPVGGQFQLLLPDGTKVWLNAQSSLHYPLSFNGSERKVELTGEAYFEVTKNAAKPFVVSVKDMKVEVLGTHFNVMAYDDEIEMKTTLLEGSVKVKTTNASKLISPGQQALVSQKSFDIKSADIKSEMAWKEGMFRFDKVNLATIMRQIARWYNVDIVYEGAIPTNRFVGEINRSDKLDKVLKILELSDIHFRTEGRKIIVRK